MERLLKYNNDLLIVKALKSYNLDVDSEFIVLRFCHYFVDLNQEEMNISILERIYDHPSRFRHIKSELMSGEHELHKKHIIENTNDSGFANTENFRLTDKARDELLDEYEAQISKRSMKGLIKAEFIAKKEMFYPDNLARQIQELTNLLQEDKFTEVINNLEKQGLRKGFACLFKGGPGTGKTETAYQIARFTGRDIMLVDIAGSKSMWFGESEKKIKEIFTSYNTAVKRSNLCPILLFNEADAIINKRQELDVNRGGPGKTENAMQNIILQEIENLNGILIATTTLVVNMDKAFDRRFLYKIEFGKPTPDARKSIWHSMIPGLSDTDVNLLAKDFEFSGGQIENIARRQVISSTLTGSAPYIEDILNYCKEELQNNEKHKSIGFGV
jgi:SpoVK/Ycf46/Vps4 family AAA+-type ATPase